MAELHDPARRTNPGPSTLPQRLGLVLLVVSLFGCDHATKIAAEQSLSNGRAIDVVSGVLELRFAPNPDTAFSLLHRFGIATSPGLLLAAASVAILAVVTLWIASRRRASRAQHVGFALILAGALGNVVDRAIRGYVVDFVHLTWWPIFNVADIAVVAGSILLGLCAVFPRKDAGDTGAAPPRTVTS